MNRTKKRISEYPFQPLFNPCAVTGGVFRLDRSLPEGDFTDSAGLCSDFL
jgi:hypothetical protein